MVKGQGGNAEGREKVIAAKQVNPGAHALEDTAGRVRKIRGASRLGVETKGNTAVHNDKAEPAGQLPNRSGQCTRRCRGCFPGRQGSCQRVIVAPMPRLRLEEDLPQGKEDQSKAQLGENRGAAVS